MIKLKQLIKEEIVDDIIKSGRFKIITGSSTLTDTKPTAVSVKDEFEHFILHYFMDLDFYHNYDKMLAKKYLDVVYDDIVKPALNNLTSFVKKYVNIDNNGVYRINKNFSTEKFVNNYIKTSKKLPNKIKEDYYDYRLQYTGKKPW